MGKHWEKFDRYSSWRRISIGMWNKPDDPTIYGFEIVDVSNMLPYLEEVSEHAGVKVSPTTFFVKMIADIFERQPSLNTIVINNKVLRRKSIDIFCQVALPNDDAGQADLSGVKLAKANEMDVVDIAKKLRSRATDVRTGQDAEMEKTKSMVDFIPPLLMPKMLELVDFLTHVVPFDLDDAGVRSNPFGSAMVTSVANFDIKQGFAPLVPLSRTPLVILPGCVHDHVFAEDGEAKVKPAITVSMTFDHRCFDGYQIGYVVRTMRKMMHNPRDFYPAPEAWAKLDTDGQQTPRPEDRAPVGE